MAMPCYATKLSGSFARFGAPSHGAWGSESHVPPILRTAHPGWLICGLFVSDALDLHASHEPNQFEADRRLEQIIQKPVGLYRP